MRYATVCSGIGAPEQAFYEMWGAPVFTSEIEPFPCAVLKHHYPGVPNYGDMTKFKDWPEHKLDLIVGGTPCQAFSVAGLRRSLKDDRGNLTLTFLRLAERYKPRYIMWENVPGVLNTGDNAFGQFLSGLTGHDTELHPTGGRWTRAGFIVGPERVAAWRVLNAEFFGVPQRRKRVFVIASPRALGFAPCQILFEPGGMLGDTQESKEEGQRVASFTPAGFGGYREGVGTVRASGRDLGGGSETIVFENHRQDARYNQCKGVTPAVVAKYGTGGGNVPFCIQGAGVTSQSSNGSGINKDVAFTLNGLDVHAVAVPVNMQVATRSNKLGRGTGFGIRQDGDPSYTIQAAHSHAVWVGAIIRKLTPKECGRLQGFPDGHAQVPCRNKPAKDAPQYKAFGNSMAVPVVKRIGERIQLLEDIQAKEAL